jgi:hypothetical protein
MKARVRYCREYNGQEGYAVEIYTERQSFDDWGLDSFFPLVRREGADKEEERNFVHYGLINKISHLRDLGYTVIFM